MSKYDRYEVYSWATNALDFIEKEQKIKVADFSRAYEWDSHKVAELLQELADAKATQQHIFFGSVLYTIRRMEKTKDVYRNIYEVTLIDGQQRIATLMVMLLALRHVLKKHPPTVQGDKLVAAIDRLLTVELDGQRSLRFVATPHQGTDELLWQLFDSEHHSWIDAELAKDAQSERADLKHSNIWHNFQFLVHQWNGLGLADLQAFYKLLAEEVYFIEVSFREDGRHDLVKIYEHVNNLGAK